MAIYTYVGNRDPAEHTGQISLRDGALLLKMGSYADITPQEYASLAGRFILELGIVGVAPLPAVNYDTGGRELQYAQIISNYGPTTALVNLDYDIPGLAINDVIVGSRPVMVEAFVPVMTHTVVGSQLQLRIFDITGAPTGITTASYTAGGNGVSGFARGRLPAGLGPRQFKAAFRANAAGDVTIWAAAELPAYILATEV